MSNMWYEHVVNVQPGYGITSITNFHRTTSTWDTTTVHPVARHTITLNDEARMDQLCEALSPVIFIHVIRTGGDAVTITYSKDGDGRPEVKGIILRLFGMDLDTVHDYEQVLGLLMTMRHTCAHNLMLLKSFVPTSPTTPMVVKMDGYDLVAKDSPADLTEWSLSMSISQDLRAENVRALSTSVPEGLPWHQVDHVLQTCHRPPDVVYKT
jgi:hypothetical protein